MLSSFDGHKFDWRWEVLEVDCEQLVERWEIMQKFYDHEAMTKGETLTGTNPQVLHKALVDDRSDSHLPVHLMIHSVANLAQAQGHNARWMRGCDCHADLLLRAVSPKKRKGLMQQAGCESGHCPMMGRRLSHCIHGGLQQMRANIEQSGSVEHNKLMLKAKEIDRALVTRFDAHVKGRLTSIMDAKFAFIMKPPALIAGLAGMYFGAGILECMTIGKNLLNYWERRRGRQHRITVHLFSSDRLVRELEAFAAQPPPYTAALHRFPYICLFALKVQLLTTVGHFLEGRHRYMKHQILAGGSNSTPVLHSFRMRTPEHLQQLTDVQFTTWLASVWMDYGANRGHVSKLLRATHEEEDFKGKPHWQKVAMLYGYDQATQFLPVPHMQACARAWKSATQQAEKPVAPQSPMEKEACHYFKHRFEVGATFALPSDLASLASPRQNHAVSSLSGEGIVAPFFAVPSRAAALLLGDVVFIIVDAWPEKKKIFSSVRTSAVTTQIVVRAHNPTEDDLGRVPKEWQLQRWDVRGWAVSEQVRCSIEVLATVR